MVNKDEKIANINKFYIYQHTRLDTNEIFYIGIGSNYRCNNKINRNNYWKNIVNITKYSIEIVLNNLTRQEACEIEKYLIAYYGRKDLGLGLLVNRTDGGDTNSGKIISKETRLKMKNAKIGKKASEETKLKMRNSRKINNNYKTRKVIDMESLIVYNSIKHASENLNINYTLLRSHLYKRRYNKTNIRYYDEYQRG